jgi:hypothetical protein
VARRQALIRRPFSSRRITPYVCWSKSYHHAGLIPPIVDATGWRLATVAGGLGAG